MTDQNSSANINLVADENDNINCTNCSECSDCSECTECTERTECVDFTQEMLERHGMLFLSRLQ